MQAPTKAAVANIKTIGGINLALAAKCKINVAITKVTIGVLAISATPKRKSQICFMRVM